MNKRYALGWSFGILEAICVTVLVGLGTCDLRFGFLDLIFGSVFRLSWSATDLCCSNAQLSIMSCIWEWATWNRPGVQLLWYSKWFHFYIQNAGIVVLKILNFLSHSRKDRTIFACVNMGISICSGAILDLKWWILHLKMMNFALKMMTFALN